MELANIESLVVKYENAETTLKEEDTLRTYFASNKVAPHLKEYQLIFNYFISNTDEMYTKKIILNTSVISLPSFSLSKLNFDKILKAFLLMTTDITPSISSNLSKVDCP